MEGLDDLLKGSRQGGGGGLGDLLGGILGGGGRGGSVAGGQAGGAIGLLLPAVASLLMNGGLQKILGRLQASGRGAEAQSWVSTGENEPVDGAAVRQALDDDEIASIATQLGVSEDEAAEAVARVLPDVVDQVTPAGQVPPDDELDQKFGRLHELGRSQG
jgi:uncharacterized protein YidB (DUF937 family)